MYAIVKSGGKQYRVERGQRLLVERLSAAEGETIALQPLLYRSEEAVFDEAGLKKVTVSATVLGHERGPKLRVFKFKPKRGYKRRTGHRQELTRIEVTDIGAGGAPAKAAPAKAKAKAAAPAAEAIAPAAKATAPAAENKTPAKAKAKAEAGTAEKAKAKTAEKED